MRSPSPVTPGRWVSPGSERRRRSPPASAHEETRRRQCLCRSPLRLPSRIPPTDRIKQARRCCNCLKVTPKRARCSQRRRPVPVGACSQQPLRAGPPQLIPTTRVRIGAHRERGQVLGIGKYCRLKCCVVDGGHGDDRGAGALCCLDSTPGLHQASSECLGREPPAVCRGRGDSRPAH
jgi:hypothetical protein